MEEDKLKNEEVFEIAITKDGVMININMFYNTNLKSEINIDFKDKKSLLKIISIVENIKVIAMEKIKEL